MFEVLYAIRDENTGREGVLRIAGGVWSGEACAFEFADTVHGLSGTVSCDWREPRARLGLDENAPGDPGAQRLLETITTLLSPFHRSTFRDAARAGLSPTAATDRHGSDSAGALVDHLLQLAPPGKLLHAGCGTGQVVSALCARGIDAHGFDHRPDLEDAALPDVGARLRRGGVDQIPFGPEDRFETLLAIDLFEHVPEPEVAAMVAEFARLGVRRVISRVAHCEFHRPGHVTLRPLSWWDRRFSPWFRRNAPIGQCQAAAAFGADPSLYLRTHELIDVPRRPAPTPPTVTHSRRT